MSNVPSSFRGPAGVVIARDTVDLLSGREIPTTPANYEIWATYRAGINPDLAREIETRLANGEPFTDDVNNSLFERFFANTRLSTQVAEASATITRELTEAFTTLREAGHQSGTLSNALSIAADSLTDKLDLNGFRQLATELAATTREMADHNRKLSEQMQTSARRVEALQTALESVRLQALSDGLTGLANRRHFDETMKRRIEEAQADPGRVCLLLCDIDHFKRFNDTWGHQVGDQVLRFIASVLRQHASGDFLAARYGGEEFALVMPRTTLSQAQTVAAGIQQSVRSKLLKRKSTGETLSRVTLSFGIAQLRVDEDVNDLIARADACLYASKRGGRDRITTDEELERLEAA